MAENYPLIYDDATVSSTGQTITPPLPEWVDFRTALNAENFNKIRNSILEIEKALGRAPQGTYSTVRDRLDALILGGGVSSAGVLDVILPWATLANNPSAGLIVCESTETIGITTFAVASTASGSALASSGDAEVKGIATVSNYVRIAGISDVICAAPVNIKDKLFLSSDIVFRGYATKTPTNSDGDYLVYIGSALTASDPITGVCSVLLNIQRPIYLESGVISGPPPVA